jgi:vacuolar protein sorting-associated protein 13A/C
MKVADFFTSGIAPADTSTENASAEIVTLHTSHQTEISSKAKKATVVKSKSSATTAIASPPPSSSMMTVNIRVEKPDIILVENMDDMDTNAIIFNVCTMKVKFNSFR